MKFVRLVLAVLLSLAVPFAPFVPSTATAAVVMPVTAAADTHHAMRMSGNHQDSGAAKSDCCGGHAHKQPDNPCKSAQDCKACSACSVIPVSIVFQQLPTAAQMVAAMSELFVPSGDLRGFWRPPRSL
ncbi:MAG: hypothetical protein LBU45_03995 [Azoarcus sp.]|jgi:hypothetical protein|nr:hypothetical protein [Azoarcus sp.]